MTKIHPALEVTCQNIWFIPPSRLVKSNGLQSEFYTTVHRKYTVVYIHQYLIVYILPKSEINLQSLLVYIHKCIQEQAERII